MNQEHLKLHKASQTGAARCLGLAILCVAELRLHATETTNLLSLVCAQAARARPFDLERKDAKFGCATPYAPTAATTSARKESVRCFFAP